jgi:ankyrin repeat protein
VELLKYILEERGLHAYDDGPERRLIDCLLSAAASGNQAVVEFLCTDNGLNVASCNDVGLSALHAAAASGHHRLCEYLLSHGATVTALRSGCPSALHLAAFFGQLDVVALLLNHTVAVRTHVSINIGPDAFARHFALPTKVLESDGDWRRVKTPVDAALWRIPTHCPDDPRCQRKRRCATYLIESGAALSGGEVALGVLFGDENLTLAALEAGSDPDQTLVSGETALQAALAAGLELVSFELLELGAQLRGGEIQSAMKIGRADLLHAVKSRYRDRGNLAGECGTQRR